MIPASVNKNDRIWNVSYATSSFVLIIILNILDYYFTSILVNNSYTSEKNPLLQWLIIYYDSLIPIIIAKIITITFAWFIFNFYTTREHKTTYFVTTACYNIAMLSVIIMSFYTTLQLNT